MQRQTDTPAQLRSGYTPPTVQWTMKNNYSGYIILGGPYHIQSADFTVLSKI